MSALPSDWKREYFTLTEEHVKLLRAAYTWWWPIEWGSPGIDPKRPFGNGDLLGDMYEILKGKKTPDHWEDLPGPMRESFLKLYRELETALQVVLTTGTFEPGRYSTEQYFRNWVRDEEQEAGASSTRLDEAKNLHDRSTSDDA